VTGMALLKIRGMRVEFPSRRGDVVAAKDVNLDLASGEILGIVGESGAGKSTIANAVLDLLEPPGIMPEGEVYLDGKRIDGLQLEEMRKIRGKHIGMIFQDPLTSLNPLQTIEEQLSETILTHLPMNEKQAQARAIEMLDKVGIPDPAIRIKHYPHQFSGGMRQRVVIALSLCAEPEVILADEPTTALDVSIQAQILDLMRKLVKETGVGMIIITHDMGVISDVCDRVMVMYRGDVVEVGPTRKILGDPDHPYTRSLISAVPRPDKRMHRFPLVEYIEEAGVPQKPIDISTHWLGKSRNFKEKKSDALVSIKNLEMRFMTVNSIFKSRRKFLNAVDDVSFDIREGEVFGLVGESGSGKSTVARLISGIYKPYGGHVFFDGTDLTALGSRKAVNHYRRQMQMIFQDPFSSLNGRMRVGDIVAEPIKFHKLASSNAEVKSIVNDLLDHVGLGAIAAKKFPHEFSGGQRQRISIARALATRPRFLICDEPTSALDVSIQAQVLNLLKDLQEELSLTMLFISHDLPVIRQVCDRVAVMRDGKLVEVADTEDLFETPQTEYSRHLLDLMPRLEGLDCAS
jgi:peptide/nickel transport system ATP-binding protein